MRRRLLIALTLFAAIAVIGFAVPLSLTIATSRTQELVLGRSGDADRFAALADAAAATRDSRALATEVERYYDLYGENVLIVDAKGDAVVNAGIDTAAPHIVDAVADARRNQRPRPVERLAPWSSDRMLVARPTGTGVQVNGVVVIEATTQRARSDIARGWALVAAGAIAAMALFSALAVTLSRWVLRPLAALSQAVEDLTATLPKPRAEAAEHATIVHHHGGPPEVRAVAEAFDAMALAVVDSADAQRQLVADTAHAMRNPLAALMIRLDSLGVSIPEHAQPTFAGASAEVERLTGLLDGLLSLAVAEAVPDFGASSEDGACDVVQVVGDRIDAWRNAYEDAAIELVVAAGPTSAEARIPAGILAQILDVALSNSSRYAGTGARTTVSVDVDSHSVRVRVSDNGTGVSADELGRLTTRFFRGSSAAGSAGGSGLGLPIAAALTQSRRGVLTVESADPHGLAVTVTLEAKPR